MTNLLLDFPTRFSPANPSLILSGKLIGNLNGFDSGGSCFRLDAKIARFVAIADFRFIFNFLSYCKMISYVKSSTYGKFIHTLFSDGLSLSSDESLVQPAM